MTTADFDGAIAAIQSALRATPPEISPAKITEDIAQSYDHESMTNRLQDADYFVAETNGKIVGVIGLKNAELRTYFVHKDVQGTGVGRALYNAVENKAQALGHQAITVSSSQFARPIYEHYGFKVTGEKHKERLGIPYFDYLMKKDL